MSVWRDGADVTPALPQQRTVLALLLASAAPVSHDAIREALWPGDPPPSAANIIHRHIGKIRRLLEPDLPSRAPGSRLLPAAGGYRLQIKAEELDLLRFRELADRADKETVGDGSKPHAVELFACALDEWKGRAADGIPTEARSAMIFAALDHERLHIVGKAADVALSCGATAKILPHLRNAADEQPFDEALQARLVLVLAAGGKQAEALETHKLVRIRLAEELGIDPGAELRAAHQQVLGGRFPATRTLGPSRSTNLGQPADLPPLSTAPSQAAAAGHPPAQLPADLGVFAGREAEFTQLLGTHPEPSASPPAVLIRTITGMGGIGKSTLAVHLAHRVAHRFPDGQLYVNLHGFSPGGGLMDPSEAMRGFLTALGVATHRLPADLNEQAALYRSLLAGRRVLVLLDNARDADQVRSLIPGSPGCMVLITSRNRMSSLIATSGALPFALGSLTATDARQVLTLRLGSTRLRAEPGAVEEIISLCAGLPLALSLVAARAAAHPDFPLSAIAAELHDAHGSLDAFTDPDPGVDVRSAFSWSYQALTQEAARLFRHLAPHPGTDITTPSTASLTALTEELARALLAELAHAHLLTEHTPGRYTFHDLLRIYAAELTRLDDPEPEHRAAAKPVIDHSFHIAHTRARPLRPHAGQRR
ncbi:BTAD domain-containing putative transcriptional regulator [Streptomyces sp. NPDC056672]|uniref:AfsR/SARP family transcriptional regulator n=1 Tax=Streptomyces sp. NPDC056672 TaxID=3345906 RepID=UPI0036C3F150